MPIGYTNMSQQQRGMWLIGQLSSMFAKSNTRLQRAFKMLLFAHLPKITKAGRDSRTKLEPIWETYLQNLNQSETGMFTEIGDVFQ